MYFTYIGVSKKMEVLNLNDPMITPYASDAAKMICGAACSFGCAGISTTCAGLCFADGPTPFGDAAAVGAIGVVKSATVGIANMGVSTVAESFLN